MNEQAVCCGRIFRFCCVLIQHELQRTDESAGPGANRLQLIEDDRAQRNALEAVFVSAVGSC